MDKPLVITEKGKVTTFHPFSYWTGEDGSVWKRHIYDLQWSALVDGAIRSSQEETEFWLVIENSNAEVWIGQDGSRWLKEKWGSWKPMKGSRRHND